LLGFVRSNLDFSKGYGRKNKKKATRVQVVGKTSQTVLLGARALRPTAASDPTLEKRSEYFWFWQEIVDSPPSGLVTTRRGLRVGLTARP
jgi:hypothetical protein